MEELVKNFFNGMKYGGICVIFLVVIKMITDANINPWLIGIFLMFFFGACNATKNEIE